MLERRPQLEHAPVGDGPGRRGGRDPRDMRKRSVHDAGRDSLPSTLDRFRPCVRLGERQPLPPIPGPQLFDVGPRRLGLVLQVCVVPDRLQLGAACHQLPPDLLDLGL